MAESRVVLTVAKRGTQRAGLKVARTVVQLAGWTAVRMAEQKAD
jgi:hypothetical protein